MTRRIAELATDELLTLVRSGSLDDFQLLDVLRSPFCTPQIAELVASMREHLGTQSIREKLAGFPGLNNAKAVNLLGSLPWASLLAVGGIPSAFARRRASRRSFLRMFTLQTSMPARGRMPWCRHRNSTRRSA